MMTQCCVFKKPVGVYAEGAVIFHIQAQCMFKGMSILDI